MWEKEIKIIEGMGRLYPVFSNVWIDDVYYAKYRVNNHSRAAWVYMLCRWYLDYRIPSLEKFMKTYGDYAWRYYKSYFEIED